MLNLNINTELKQENDLNLDIDSDEDLTTKVLHVSKISKILEKGKLVRFKVIVATGDNKEFIGLGIGKDPNFSVARQKAINSSYKNLIFVNHFKLNDQNILPLQFKLRLKKNIIYFSPRKSQTGIRASKLIYVLLKLAGFNHVSAKRIGPKNILNNIYIFFSFIRELNTLKLKNKIQLF